MPHRQQQFGVILAGLGVLLGGAWIIAYGAGLPIVSAARYWPLVLVVSGLAMLLQSVADRPGAAGLLFFGVICLLVGVFLLGITLQIGDMAWATFGKYAPVLLLIAGCAFLIVYLFGGMGRLAILFASLLLGALGTILLPLTLGLWGSVALNQALRYWPVLVIFLGGAIFLSMRGRPTDPLSRS